MARKPAPKREPAAPKPTPPESQSLDQAISYFLSRIPLFAEVTLAEAMDVMRLPHQVDLKAGQVLFEQGDPPGAFWVLGEGCEVEVSASREPGSPPVVLA
jgi:hypothetical protein